MTIARRKYLIHRAAEYVALCQSAFSCLAIKYHSLEDALPNLPSCTSETVALRRQYVEFYEQDIYEWPALADLLPEEKQAWRLMLLAWFAEVGPEGIA